MNHQPPILVEIIGPAGAGKSTLLCELKRRNRALPIFADRLRLRDLRNLPFYLGSALAAMPILLRPPWHDWFSREELSRICYLMGMDRVLQRRARGTQILVVDQGPIFELTQLSEFGPARLQAKALAPWWSSRYQQWAPLVSLVIWLDAPDELLIGRIRERAQSHTIKACSDTEARLLLTRYRNRFNHVMAQLKTRSTIDVLTLETASTPVEEVADHALGRIASLC